MEADVRTLAQWPARMLAQQAHALLHIRGDRHEAGVRLHAALESRDQREVDVPTLRQAARKLDRGDSARAQELIDEALSQPLGARSGKLFHGAGRELAPAAGAQAIFAIIAGVLLLAAGGWLLLRGRHRAAASGG